MITPCRGAKAEPLPLAKAIAIRAAHSQLFEVCYVTNTINASGRLGERAEALVLGDVDIHWHHLRAATRLRNPA
jgi:hypothetical protein